MRRLIPPALIPVLALAGLLSLPSAAAAQGELQVVAQLRAWPTASKPIAYGGRIWLANSVKGRNHNSADIYSYAPATGKLRFERHLFSQDAGDPLVANGLLYWPFEDARVSLGWGEIMATDGKAWRLLTVPSAQIFHTHALAEAEGRLIAATSAWRGGLQESADRGASWEAVYDHPTQERQVSRIVSLAAVDDRVVAFLTSKRERLVLSLHNEAVSRVAALPRDPEVVAMAAGSDWVYLALREADGDSLWRSDGMRAELLAAPRKDWQVRGLAAQAGDLWLATADEEGGLLWRSRDGREWAVASPLRGGTPTGIAVLDGVPFVTGTGGNGFGLLWGPKPGSLAQAKGVAAGTLNRQIQGPAPATPDWNAEAQALAALLADPANYAQPRLLRNQVFRLARIQPPAGFFTRLLEAPMPTTPLRLIGGAVEVPAEKLGRWILLWGMTVSGHGPVPPALIAEPWSAPANPSQKYFEAAPAAIRAAVFAGQRDRATIDALIGRLDAGGPPWLRSDAMGGLAALTGQGFGPNPEAWRDWWAKARETWPDS